MRPIPQATCLGLIHQFEGEAGKPRLIPARDPAGNWEIGWGHKLPVDGDAHPPITYADADALAIQDLQTAATAAWNTCLIAMAHLTDNQYAALIDFAFNEGAHALMASTLAHWVCHFDFAQAADEFDRWVYAHVDGKVVKFDGLVRRRAAEKALFLA